MAFTGEVGFVTVKDLRWYGAAGRLEEVGRPIVLSGGTVPDVGTGPDEQFVVAAQNGTSPGSDVYAVRGGAPEAEEVLWAGDANQNNVLDENEDADLGIKVFSAYGFLAILGNAVLTNGSGGNSPLGGGLTISDGTADYGSVPPGTSRSCFDTGDCYHVSVQGPRPSPHWDEVVTETISNGVRKSWPLHVGGSFTDVPATNLFYRYVENLLHHGVTAGGACGGYCPTDGVKRQQMAVFLLKTRFGPSFTPPPATGTIFTDVTLANPFAAWIEALFLLGVTGGCSGGPPPAPTQFCPDAIVNRQQMAVFLLKTLEGSAYVPPDAAGIFQDVPLTNPFVKWIEELYARQVTGGCVASPLQYCPTNPTNRQQMAAFLVKTFGLLLYGP